MSAAPSIVAIVGPTAVGKSSLAMALAQDFRAEIVSADSRQVYRYLDIGTAKPSPAERERVPHHMIDVVHPDDTYSAARYRQDAEPVLKDIARRGNVAFVVGGTGHYVESLLERISIPRIAPDLELRARIQRQLETDGIDAVLGRLAALDPTSAARIDRANPRRIVRALEIVETTGEPIPPLQRDPLPALWLGLTMERDRLYQIADRRVEAQVAAGLVEETRKIAAMGYSLDLPSLNSLAYREMRAHLRGEMTLHEATEAYKRSTHQLIRRQMTWFRANDRIRWLEVTAGLPLSQTREAIAQFL